MKPIQLDTIYTGDCLEVLKTLPDKSVHCCVTFPPYYALRDYGMENQIGREISPREYLSRLTEVFTEVRRVLRSDGTLWLNVSDTYAGKGHQGDFVDPKNPNGRNGQAAIAKAFAESEFEQYRVIQDQLYQSDFERLMADASEDSK